MTNARDHTTQAEAALIARLRADLDDFTADISSPPPMPVAGSKVGPGMRDRRRWIVTGIAAATVAVLIAGLALITHRGTAELESAPTTPPDPPSGLPVPPSPAGWVLVEWGDVRLSLPPELDPFPRPDGSTGPCFSSGGGGILEVNCGDRVVTVFSGTVAAAGAGAAAGAADATGAAERVNGLTVNRTLLDCELCRQATELLLVETNSMVRLAGLDNADVDAVAATVGVSSKWRIANEPAPDVPDDWQAVELDGFSFEVPGDWPVTELPAAAPDPERCGFRGVPAGVTIGRGAMDAATVRCSEPPVVTPASDGVRVYPLDPTEFLDQLGDHPVYDRTIALSSGMRYLLRVGLGGDGTIGRTILGSVVISSPSTTAPPTTAPGELLAGLTEYETMGTVIETGSTGPQLCFGTLDSYPPQCGGGIGLAGWSWDLVDGEQRSGDTAWLDEVYLRGTFDAPAASLTVIEARTATDDDRSRLIATAGYHEPDYSIPCAEPAGGWPARNAEWPGEQIAAIDGYAGAWVDSSQQVMTVKFVGDLDAARAAVRRYYSDEVCIVPAQHTESELRSTQQQLMALSSVRVLGATAVVDATGEWVEATIIAPDPALQTALDEQYGVGVVQIISMLVPRQGL
jgi:hypothetical protein